MAWTDERLDDFAERVDARFDAIDRRLDRVEDSVAALRDTVHTGFQDLHGLIMRLSIGIVGGVIVGLIGVIAAILGTS